MHARVFNLHFVRTCAFNISNLCARARYIFIHRERQTKRIREEYVRSILRQDMTWFNTHQAGELATRLSAYEFILTNTDHVSNGAIHKHINKIFQCYHDNYILVQATF